MKDMPNGRKLMRVLSFFALVTIASACANKTTTTIGKTDYLVVISTTYGDITMLLYDKTPLHKQNFIKLSNKGYFDSTYFHRVLKDFVVQGGDPHSKPGQTGEVGDGGPGYTIPAEIDSTYVHKKGAIGAARQSDELNPDRRSSGSQFYIVQAAEGAHHLDGSYTVFGEVLSGMAVVDSIANQEVKKGGVPKKPVYIEATVKPLKRKHVERDFGFRYGI